MFMDTTNDSFCLSTVHKPDDSIHKKAWMKITGPAAAPFGRFFFGSSVVIQSGIIDQGRGEKEHKANIEKTAASRQTVDKHLVDVGFYNAADSTLQGNGADEVKPQTGTASKIIVKGSDGALKCIKVLRAFRIVLLGDTGAGKSTLGNIIFGEDVFKPGRTTEYDIQSRSARERRITVLDTPGFSIVDKPGGDLKKDVARCITKCSPGPHVFLIVLKVEESSEQLLAFIRIICQSFSEEEFKYAAIVFTHGDQTMELKDYIKQNKHLQDLVDKCSERYYVLDHKKSSGEDKKRFQSELLNMIDKLVMENKGGCYTNKMIQAHKRELGNPKNDRADSNASKSLWIKLSGPEGHLVAKALFGLAAVKGSPLTEEKKTGESITCGKEGIEAKHSEPKDTPVAKSSSD